MKLWVQNPVAHKKRIGIKEEIEPKVRMSKTNQWNGIWATNRKKAIKSKVDFSKKINEMYKKKKI
jgi:hypothetical protein